jgi:hypothetical protein
MGSLHIPEDYCNRWNDNSLPALSRNFDWQGRDDYLEWVNNWKKQLVVEICNIHAAKHILKQKDASVVSRAAAQRDRSQLAIHCANLYFLRKHAKLQAGRQTPTRAKQQHKEYLVTH